MAVISFYFSLFFFSFSMFPLCLNISLHGMQRPEAKRKQVRIRSLHWKGTKRCSHLSCDANLVRRPSSYPSKSQPSCNFQFQRQTKSPVFISLPFFLFVRFKATIYPAHFEQMSLLANSCFFLKRTIEQQPKKNGFEFVIRKGFVKEIKHICILKLAFNVFLLFRGFLPSI